MNYIFENDRYYGAILNMAYEKYRTDVSHHTFLEARSKQAFSDFLQKQLSKMKCISIIYDDKCIGFIIFSLNSETDKIWCNIPVWGYGATSIKAMTLLFTKLAEQLVATKTNIFTIHLYAHDEEFQRLFSFMQFGIICESDVRSISRIEHNSNITIRKIEKIELKQRWESIWYLLSQLIDHLKKSPIFYPGEEFTEDLYGEFFADINTNVYIAEDKGRIVGLIEANSENYNHAFGDDTSINVGEAFVLPEYRGTKVAQALLSYLEDDLLTNHIQFDWVMHGTANPNARGFWNKYFETFEYEFIRKIDI